MSSGLATGTAVATGPVTLLRRRPIWLAASAATALAVVLVAGILFGNVSLPLPDTLAILGHRLLGLPMAVTWPASAETIVMELRLPRVLTAAVVGMGLAVAGTTFQGLLRNPLADPYVLGTASGAALGAAIGVLVPVQLAILGFGVVSILAFCGALGAVAIVYRVSGGGTTSGSTVLLVGYAVGSVFAAGLALALYLAGDDLRQIVAYLLGSFAHATWAQIAVGLPVILIGTLLICGRTRSLDALLLGDDAAASLGVDVSRERRWLLLLASLVTGVAVALAGLIGFVGLVVPHVVRMAVGSSARLVLPLSAIVGAVFMVVADLFARIPGELPVGIVTAIIGVPVFVALLRRTHGGYEL